MNHYTFILLFTAKLLVAAALSGCANNRGQVVPAPTDRHMGSIATTTGDIIDGRR